MKQWKQIIKNLDKMFNKGRLVYSAEGTNCQSTAFAYTFLTLVSRSIKRHRRLTVSGSIFVESIKTLNLGHSGKWRTWNLLRSMGPHFSCSSSVRSKDVSFVPLRAWAHAPPFVDRGTYALCLCVTAAATARASLPIAYRDSAPRLCVKCAVQMTNRYSLAQNSGFD